MTTPIIFNAITLALLIVAAAAIREDTAAFALSYRQLTTHFSP